MAEAKARPVIAVDLDGFLWDFYLHVALWHDRTFGTSLAPLVHTEWRTVWLEHNWGGTSQEAGDKVNDFYRQLDFLSDVEPMLGAVDAMRALGEKYDLVLITGNIHLEKSVIRAWLTKWFSGLFVNVIITDTWDSKVGAMRAAEAVLMLEDRSDTSLKIARAGFLAIVSGPYRWSRGTETANVRFVDDKSEVPEAVDRVLAA